MSGNRKTPRACCWVSPRLIEHRAGQRGAALPGLQLTCQVGVHQLDLLAQVDDKGLKLLGMATTDGRPAAPIEIELFDTVSGTVERTVETSVFGEFEFEAPGSRRWGLRVGRDPFTPCVRLWEVLR